MRTSQSTSLSTIVAAIAVAVVITLLALTAIRRFYRGDGTLLRSAELSETTISPNADGEQDALTISYEISRNATVSIYFEDGEGNRHYFRRERTRAADQYGVLFSGVVEAYSLPDDAFDSEILSRLLQDGDYTWTIEAIDEDGVRETLSGALTIRDADTALPIMAGFAIYPTYFTPNRDGIDDRVTVQFDLKKEVAEMRVFLVDPDGVELQMSELPRDVPANSVGRHVFDYEGGVDFGAPPPLDGTYDVFAWVEDAEGQKMQVASQLTLEFGGVPRAEIVSPVTGDTLEFSTTAVQLCNTIQFTATVRNYGETPVRTTGPEPGTVYDSDWNYNTLGWNTESGAFRFAIGFEDEIRNYGYRWATGKRENLTLIGDHYYLMPGQQAVVTGGIRITGQLGQRNPQPMYAGLIHEDVEIANLNNRVDPKAVEIDYPADIDSVSCEPREVPVKTVEQ